MKNTGISETRSINWLHNFYPRELARSTSVRGRVALPPLISISLLPDHQSKYNSVLCTDRNIEFAIQVLTVEAIETCSVQIQKLCDTYVRHTTSAFSLLIIEARRVKTLVTL